MTVRFNNIHLVFVLLAMLLISLPLYAQRQEADIDYGVHGLDYSRVGRSGFQFLKLPTTSRFAALAGAGTALGFGDAGAALANPACMTDVQNLDAFFSSMSWIADIQYSSASLVKSFSRVGSFGLSFINVDYGTMERTEHQIIYDDDGESTGKTMPAYNLGTFTGGDIAVGLSYARDVTDRLKFGITARYVYETLDDAGTGVWSIDVGTIYYTGFKSLRIAMLGQHFGPDAEFLGYDEQIQIPAQSVRLPQQLHIGAAFDILEERNDSPHRLTLSTEFINPNDGPEKVNVGAEYEMYKFVTLRGGYRFNYDEESFTAGAAIKIVTDGIRINLNYAYVDFGRLNSVNMFSVGFNLK